ncbi:fumarylacetoacetate hydrolase family protein [Vibrio profundum]|uniref:fumarylacetoacetate hydrolase family protein n=1 Tax=Vibrio profundum TaxID=2910247 RepID=UPI003D0AA4EA
MKFIRFVQDSATKLGCIGKGNSIYDLSSIISDHSIENLYHQLSELQSLDLDALPSIKLSEVDSIEASVANIGKVICIGANSKIHNKEIGVSLKEPMFFLKPLSAVSGALDPVPYTIMTKQLDWEAELAVVIAKSGKNIAEQNAMEYVMGYSCFNDLSDRYWQFKDGGLEIGGQTTIAKCFDGYAPLGPWLVTQDEIENPSNLNIELKVNGEVRQCFNSSDYLRNVAQCVSQLSRFMTLNPGDVIALGSGPGNAKSWNEQYLRPEDELILSIEGLGEQKQKIIRV